MKTLLFGLPRSLVFLAFILLQGCWPFSDPEYPPEKPITPPIPTPPQTTFVMEKAVHPVPEESHDPPALVDQLKRYKGQKHFLNPLPWYSRFYRRERSVEKPTPDEMNGEERDIQESDIFKLGQEGSKLLYLLNNYRGLQIISFQEGAIRPLLLGRTKASGRWPKNMYFDQDNGRILVLEHALPPFPMNPARPKDEEDDRLVIYLVSDPTNPRQSQVLPVKGRIVDSRLVGKVLYVASQQSSGHENRAVIQSFLLNDQKVELHQTLEISTPLEGRELMNIVQVKKNGGAPSQYFLVAVLRNQENLRRPSSHQVAVVDISSPEGNIRPLLKAPLEGQIRERQQTSIKDQMLLVVSNFRGADNQLRIAVESFPLSSALTDSTDQLMDPKEAQFKLHLLRTALNEKAEELRSQGIPPTEIDPLLNQYREELVSGRMAYLRNNKSYDLKMRNLYTKDEEGFLISLAPHQTLIVGSERDQQAQIQDVRFHENFLYVYWVPQNLVDPLDLFDISHPQEEIHYHGRLLFDGWIERAIPLSYRNQNLIVGLGYIQIGNDLANSKRFPQMMLFRISTGDNGVVRQEILSQLTLTDPNVWTDFNSPDKFIEFRFNPDEGTGAILFQVYRSDGHRSLSGGKLVGFDLKNLDTQSSPIFQEGGLIPARPGWLRRIFTNPEIEMVNTFSDIELQVFDLQLQPSAIGAVNDIHQAIAILELARQMRGYEVLSLNGQQRGIQIIADTDYFLNRNEGSNLRHRTHLRIVRPDQADSEIGQVLGEKVIQGQYVNSVLISPNQLLIQTSRPTDFPTDSNEQQRFTLSLLEWGPQDQKLRLYSQNFNFQSPPETAMKLLFTRPAGADLFSLPHHGLHSQQKSWYLLRGDQLFTLQFLFPVRQNQFLRLHPVEWRNCESLSLSDEANNRKQPVALHIWDNQFHITHTRVERIEQYQYLQFHRHFLTTLKAEKESLTCGPSINVPGEVLLVRNRHIITHDISLLDLIGIGEADNPYPLLSTQVNLVSLTTSTTSTISGHEAILKDLYNAEKIVHRQSIHSLPAKDSGQGSPRSPLLVFIEGEERLNPAYYWKPPRTRFPWRPIPYDPEGKKFFLTYLSLDDDSQFNQQVYQLLLKMPKLMDIPQLQSVIPQTSQSSIPSYLGAVTAGKNLQIIQFGKDDWRPRPLTLVPLNPQFEKLPPIKVAETFSYFHPGRMEQSFHYNPELESFTLLEGLFGIQQFFLRSETTEN